MSACREILDGPGWDGGRKDVAGRPVLYRYMVNHENNVDNDQTKAFNTFVGL